MTSDHLATALQTVVRVNDTKLFASLELSKSRWLVTVSAPGSEKLSKHVVIGGDGGALLNLLGRLRASAERRGGMAVQVVVIQEAGLDGFWLHRLLEANGIESHVVDPASIAVDRRHRRAKTDVDLPPGSGGVGSERHAALSMVIPSMLALASAGVR